MIPRSRGTSEGLADQFDTMAAELRDSYSALERELEERTRELEEALVHQQATGEVLKSISRSAFDLEKVLDNMLETAARLCGAGPTQLFRREGEVFVWAAGRVLDPTYREIERSKPIPVSRGTLVGRAALARVAVQIEDAWSDPEYEPKDDARIGNVRTMLGVPLLREGELVGVMALARDRVEPFSKRQVDLVSVFADQAVIAIENARLVSELTGRSQALARSVSELETLREVGTAVSSTLELKTVLATILERAVETGGADGGAVFRFKPSQGIFVLAQVTGLAPQVAHEMNDLRIEMGQSSMGEAVRGRKPVQVPEIDQRPNFPLRNVLFRAGYRAAVVVPLLGPDRVYGTLVLLRRRSGAFAQETVRLVQTLATQSVLAIHNARLFREIAEQTEQLRIASQHKSQFLANMSHELRTPLNAILGYAELLGDGIYGDLPEQARQVLARVQQNGTHLLALINDVLDLSKIEAGQLSLVCSDYSLPELVQSAVSATEPLARAKGLDLRSSTAPTMPIGRGDARRLAQVILNLVGNAIKFTDAGSVDVVADVAGDTFVLEVRDTGPGIAEADRDKIFEEFHQVDNSSTRRKGGTGLGLAISRHIVAMHGGTLSVVSQVGQGATFRAVWSVDIDPEASP